jgi:RHS repeat-associated protein
MADTDGDGVLDGEEQAAGTDPLSASSYPGDGDVNQDGRIDVGDLLLVTQIALGQRTPTPEQFIRADINRDGVVDVVDVLLLQRRILGLSFLEFLNELPGGQRLLAAFDGARDRIQLAAHAFHASLIGTAQAAVANGKLYYVHTDHLGTPKALTDETGNRVWSAVHDPFGMAVVDPGSTVEMNVRFPGQYYDGETGLHYNYFRTYDPGTGRYLESDPIGLDGGLNTFGYALNNPLIYFDPLGLVCRQTTRRGMRCTPGPGRGGGRVGVFGCLIGCVSFTQGNTGAQASLQPTIGGGLSICSAPKEPKPSCEDEEEKNCGIYDPNCDNDLNFGISPPGRAGVFLSLSFNEDGSICVNIGPHAGLPGPSVGLGGLPE